MGKPTGFLEWPRQLPPTRHCAERVQDFRDIHLEHSVEQLCTQAGRCMDCGVPFCHQGCPLGNPIPDFNEMVFRDRWWDAWLLLSTTNPFPEFTGRLCPAPCESSCVLSINQDPVTIEEIEKAIIERAFAEGWVKPRPPATRSGKRVAVVGSGPSGLAAAATLNQAGHHVTVFERDDRPGGLLRYGIPDFKMEKQVLDRRVALMEADGVEFKTGVDVGRTLEFAALRANHDAVVLALGARVARELVVPGGELNGVVQAMDYLTAQNRGCASNELHAGGKRVIILGGGDTGSDCLGTALRQGARHVTQIELLPRPPDARASHNPWPQWPMVFRTSSSQEEGGTREFAVLTQRLTGEEGALRALHTVNVNVARDDAGKPLLIPQDGTERTWDVDLLILAMGFTGPETRTVVEQLGVKLDASGNIGVDERYATCVPGVFAVGDASRGASLIVWALADGRDAARWVDAYLVRSSRLNVLTG